MSTGIRRAPATGRAPASAGSPTAHGNSSCRQSMLGVQPDGGILWDSATTRPCLRVPSIASSLVSPSWLCCDSLFFHWWGSCPWCLLQVGEEPACLALAQGEPAPPAWHGAAARILSQRQTRSSQIKQPWHWDREQTAPLGTVCPDTGQPHNPFSILLITGGGTLHQRSTKGNEQLPRHKLVPREG